MIELKNKYGVVLFSCGREELNASQDANDNKVRGAAVVLAVSRKVDLSFANLENIEITNESLFQAKLGFANFKSAKCLSCNFSQADLESVQAQDANFRNRYLMEPTSRGPDSTEQI
jgi:uncharacterized protein YjbI with pentapeptide repeats